jgi:uncharacterized protein
MAAVPVSQTHRLILQVNTNDPAAMNLTLNNASNVAQHYKEIGEKVKIEVITFGSGLHMLRDDTSPVKARIEQMALSTPEVSYKACGNTQEKMHQAEDKDIPIVAQAQVVKSGVVRVMELQETGWTYVRPWPRQVDQHRNFAFDRAPSRRSSVGKSQCLIDGLLIESPSLSVGVYRIR